MRSPGRVERRAPGGAARAISALLTAGLASALVAGACAPESATEEPGPDGSELLWFEQPARYWNSQSLHLGNGYFGVSFFGGVGEETLALTEQSMWTGGPFDGDWEAVGVNPRARKALPRIREAIVRGDVEKADALVRSDFLGTSELFGSFTSIGELKLSLAHGDGETRSYRRSLDLSTSTGRVEYEIDGVRHERELFCSYPDRVLVVTLTASEMGQVSFTASLDVFQEVHEVEAGPGRLEVRGEIDGNGRPFHAALAVDTRGGSVTPDGARLLVEGAHAATLYYTASTNHALGFPHYLGQEPRARNEGILRDARQRGVDDLRRRHVADYQALYKRVSLKLPSDPRLQKVPTDERWRRLRAGGVDTGLKTTAFHLGRYLLISSSRPGALPANLQGVWNNFTRSPWAGNYQSNINLQQIYWPSGPTNLLECQEPYIDWIRDLTVPGREIAKRVYGTGGWVSHATGNIWGHAAPMGGMRWGMYPVGAAWHARHVWDQYAFSQDLLYLEETAYPILKEAAVFWLENLVEFEGHLISAPTVSAEHGAVATPAGLDPALHDLQSEDYRHNLPGVYQDVQMIWDLFTHTAEAAAILGDTEFGATLLETRERLLPLKIGRHGQLQEWYQDIDSPEGHHRHIAHLYAVSPGRQIHPTTTPELAEAARVSLDMRGDGRFPEQELAAGGNWSRAHRISAWVRLMDGDRANRIFSAMLAEQGFENLTTYQHARYDWERPDLFNEGDGLSAHFQLDGTAAVPFFMAEMLLQSHLGEIHLLPALPAELASGAVTGLRARGGYEVDVEWEQGSLGRAVIRADHGRVPRVRVGWDIVDPEDDPRVELELGPGR